VVTDKDMLTELEKNMGFVCIELLI